MESRSKKDYNSRPGKSEKNNSDSDFDTRKKKIKQKDSSRAKSRKVFDSDDSDIPMISDGDEELGTKRNPSKHKKPLNSKNNSQDLHEKGKDERIG